MNDVGFVDYPNPPGFICVDHENARILLVEDFDHLRFLFDLLGLAPWIVDREKYKTYDEYVEENMENAVTHETLHYVLMREEGEKANKGLDYIDCTREGYQSLR